MAFSQWTSSRLADRRLPVFLAVPAILLALPGMWVGWQTDDHFHRAFLLNVPGLPHPGVPPMDLFALLKGDAERTGVLMDMGMLPWWTYEELRIAFWRPISALTHWLDYQLWPNAPALMHLQNLLWFGALVAAVTVFYRRLIGPTWVAGLAALLYAIDDARGLPAGWIANRNALLAVTFGVLALTAHDRWRRDRRRSSAVLAPLWLSLGLLSGEAALGTCAYLFAYAVFVDRGSRQRRLASLMPCGVVAAGWALAYGYLGYGTDGSGLYVDPTGEPSRFAAAVAERAPFFLLGQWGFPPADLSMLLSGPMARVMWLGAIAFLTLVALVVVPVVRQSARARFWTVGMLLATLPVCATFPSNRLLSVVGLGAMGLLAEFLGALRERSDLLPTARSWRGLARAMAGLFVLLHLIAAPLQLPLVAWSPAWMGETIRQLGDILPDDPEVARQDVVIVNAPGTFIGGFLPIIQALNGRPIPAHTRLLASGVQALEIRRADARTLVIRPARGFLSPVAAPVEGDPNRFPHIHFGHMLQRLDRLFRGDEHPLRLGQRIELSGMSVEVSALTEAGRPAEAVFRFAVPLEDSSLRWLRCLDDGYVEFTPPRVGRSVHLPPVKFSR